MRSMAIGIQDILELIKVCQDFNNKFSENETVDLFAEHLGVSKISYRVFFNDVNIESSVVYDAPSSTLGEEFDYKRIASNDRVIMFKIIRFTDAEPLSSEDAYLMQTFGEIIMSGICVKNLIKAYENARYYDSLTQLTNVSFFLNYLDKLLASGKNDIYSVACINIKNCGALNRIFGSDITDKIIRDFAQDSLDLFDQNQYEIISRLSSDSFILIALTSNIDRILETMNSSEVSVDLNGDIVDYNVNIRAGVVSLASNVRSASDIIHLAQNALVFSRLHENPDIYYLNGDGNPNGNKAFIYLSEIKEGFNSNQFFVYFKPVYRCSGNIKRMELFGAQAVLRWRKDGRLVDPYALVSSPNNSILRDIDDYMFKKTCDIINTWDSYGIKSVPIAIQISSFDYFNTAFADNLLRNIDRYHISRDRIIIEFDEASFNGHYEEMKVATQKFAKAGVPISITNYGSGTSSLKLLSEFDYQYLKISPDLMNSSSAKDMIIIENLISMAQKVGFEVICSEPEDEEIVKKAYSYGCTVFQGDLFDKPLSERFFKKRLTDSVSE